MQGDGQIIFLNACLSFLPDGKSKSVIFTPQKVFTRYSKMINRMQIVHKIDDFLFTIFPEITS